MPVAREVLERQLGRCLVTTALPFGEPTRGKVRDIYTLDATRLLVVTTDRISAFDHVLPQPIPFKGQVLNRLAAYFFEATRDLAPNHVLSVPDPNATLAIRCEPFPVEFVVRGCLAGHAWRVYRHGARFLSGAPLPDGLREGEELPVPILTPSTKAASGHDQDISADEILARGLVAPEALEQASRYAMLLFARGREMAARRGLILVDTKYEFGRAPDGRVTLIDEVHTADSSRYYYAEGYEERLRAGQPQRQLSKEFVREWLMERGFRGHEGQVPPDLPAAFRIQVARRYIELFEVLTGEPFTPDTHGDPERRIAQAVSRALGG